MRKTATICIVLLLVCVFITSCGPAPVISVTDLEGQIAYSGYGMNIMDANGTGVKQLTNNIATSISLSPDGSQIAFSSDTYNSKNAVIYLLNTDGTGLQQLTDNTSSAIDPSWSPDGQKIAFSSNRDAKDGYGNPMFSIYVMNKDGTGIVQLTQGLNDLSPTWSPDGSKIAFHNFDIFVMKADGTGCRSLTRGYWPSWSPDGQYIAYTKYVGIENLNGNFEIYLMKADGTGQRRLTINGASDMLPCWSPDSQKIAFCSSRDGGRSIYVMNIDGTGVVQLVATGDHPSWSTKTTVSQ
jgi:Tol biopolymer transport system component